MTPSSTRPVALITGASSGIGLQFAHLHAERGGDLVVVARSRERLDGLKAEFEARHHTRVLVIVKDLGLPGAPQEVYDEVTRAGVSVDILINNAGFGGQGRFHERAWEADRAMIQLNVVALTALTRLFLPDFVARKSGRVLNVSSTAGMMPGPLQAVYYATKAYVTSFSNAIAEELRGTGVTVTALLPGVTETEFAKVSGMDKTPMFAQGASAREVATAGYEGAMRGDLDVIAGVTWSQRMMLAMAPLFPKRMMLSQIRQMQEAR